MPEGGLRVLIFYSYLAGMKVFWTLLCVFLPLSLAARPMYTCPDALRSIEKGAVYSFCQDGDGAVWMCTNYGLCRFNGTRLEVKRRYLPRTGTQICSNGDQYVYVPSEEGFLRYHARSRENDLIKGSDIDYERRNGYQWVGNAPQRVIDRFHQLMY